MGAPIILVNSDGDAQVPWWIGGPLLGILVLVVLWLIVMLWRDR